MSKITCRQKEPIRVGKKTHCRLISLFINNYFYFFMLDRIGARPGFGLSRARGGGPRRGGIQFDFPY
jgi:hypothetical protein